MTSWRHPAFTLAFSLAVIIHGASASALAAHTPPKPKTPTAGGKAGACGMAYFPINVGNTWTYQSNLKKSIILKITEVGQGHDVWQHPATTITVEETFEGRTIKTQWTCTLDKGIVIPPDSFFFTGEPGGGVGTAYTVTSRDQVTLEPDALLVPDANWVEVVKADVARSDTGGAGVQHLPAKVELERHVIVHAADNVATAVGNWSALKVTFELRGRAMVGEDKAEIPAKAEHPGTYWLVKNLGPARIQDNFDKQWDLIESNLLK